VIHSGASYAFPFSDQIARATTSDHHILDELKTLTVCSDSYITKMAMATSTLPADSLDPSLRTALLESFPASLLTPDSAPLLAEVVSILRIYNLSPSDLADKWESFCLNKKHLLAEVEDGDPFQLENVRELKKHIQENLEREIRAKRGSMGSVMGTPVARGSKMGMADDMYGLPPFGWN
jgi:hypothetical protein